MKLLRSSTFWNNLVLLGVYVFAQRQGVRIPELLILVGMGAYAGKEAVAKLPSRRA